MGVENRRRVTLPFKKDLMLPKISKIPKNAMIIAVTISPVRFMWLSFFKLMKFHFYLL